MMRILPRPLPKRRDGHHKNALLPPSIKSHVPPPIIEPLHRRECHPWPQPVCKPKVMTPLRDFVPVDR
jgi:hypothetical protein